MLLLGQPRAQRYLKPLCLTLLKDETPLVQGMAIARVPQIMNSMFAPSDDDAKVGTRFALRLLHQCGFVSVDHLSPVDILTW